MVSVSAPKTHSHTEQATRQIQATTSSGPGRPSAGFTSGTGTTAATGAGSATGRTVGRAGREGGRVAATGRTAGTSTAGSTSGMAVGVFIQVLPGLRAAVSFFSPSYHLAATD